MKKQKVLVIGGGEALENVFSETFLLNRLNHIKEDYSYDPYTKTIKWKSSLQESLGNKYEILKAPNPSSDCAVYEEWKVMFEKMFSYLEGNIILLGHSLGGTFITKYLNENDFPFHISKILLVAPAFEDSEQEVLGSFNFDKKLEQFRKLSDKITLYYSLDDNVVNPRDFEKFKGVLGNISLREFNDRGHFSCEDFPEIISDIRRE